MTFLISVLGILSVLFAGVVSPGPSFLLVARTSISTGRLNGFAAAIGMGFGALIFATVVLAGLHGLLLSVPTLYFVLQIFGGIYLVYLSYSIWINSSAALNDELSCPSLQVNLRTSFFTALGTMLSNPKGMVQYGTIFAALLPREISVQQCAILAGSVFALEAGWYIFVALVLSSDVPKKTYLKFKTRIDKICGGIMLSLGIKLLWRAFNG
jgi:threonine/homoserine/homoserine lactone efflux protein